jgi:hypothetical protein
MGDDGGRLEVAYYVKLRDRAAGDRFVRELRQAKVSVMSICTSTKMQF